MTNAAFPNTAVEVLTMSYLNKMDTSDLSPEEFVDKYNEVLKKIRKQYYCTKLDRKLESNEH